MPATPKPSRILLHRTGSSAQPTLVLGNSLGTDIRLWDAQARALSSKYEVVRFNYPGHGGQPSDPIDTIADIAKALVASLDQAGIKKFAYCGISMGAAVGLELACATPQRLHALVLANTAPRFGSADFWKTRIAKARSEGLAALAAPTVDRWLTASHAREDPALVSHLCEMFGSTDLEGYVDCASAVMHFDASPHMSQVKAPCLVIAGSQDLATTVEQALALRDGIAGSCYAVLHAAHLSNLDQPDAFTTLVDTFLQRHAKTI